MIAFTGALHLDGLMDTCDGIFSFKSPEQRLTIMPTAGWARSASSGGRPAAAEVRRPWLASARAGAPEALILMPTVSRAAQVLVMWAFPAGRPGEMSVGGIFKNEIRALAPDRRRAHRACAALILLPCPVALVTVLGDGSSPGLFCLYVMGKIPGLHRRRPTAR